MNLKKFDTSKHSEISRTGVTCTQCGNKYDVPPTFMWLTLKDRPVCYTCAKFINEET